VSVDAGVEWRKSVAVVAVVSAKAASLDGFGADVGPLLPSAPSMRDGMADA
jgi:hypothetical protein